MDMQTILEQHAAWVAGNGGERADLSNADLSNANLRNANLRNANLSEADLRGADLRNANLRNANLSEANLSEANLRNANLRNANLSEADLSNADLSEADLSNADLSNADLSEADLSEADLSSTDLRNANLSNADLSNADLSNADLREANLSNVNLCNANLSNCVGLIAPSEYLAEHFESTPDGLIAYKVFGLHYPARSDWQIVHGSVISEIANPNRTNDCGCGVSVATHEWVRQNTPIDAIIWKCIIRWPWLADVVVPYNTDGKIRAGKVELVEIVK